MPDQQQVPRRLNRTTAAARVARTGEPPPPPQWQGLFREPDCPPFEDEEA